MATVIVNHRVKDFASWKVLFDSDRARRDGAGIKDIVVGEKAGDPGMVYMVWSLADPSIIEKMMSDPELQARMKEGGVISAPEVIVLN